MQGMAVGRILATRRAVWLMGATAIMVGSMFLTSWAVRYFRVSRLSADTAVLMRQQKYEQARESLQELARLDRGAACRTALAHFFDADWESSEFAGRLLAKARSRRLQLTLLEAVERTPQDRARVWLVIAAAKFARRNPEALDTIHTALNDPSTRVALTAISMIDQLADTTALPHLQQRLYALRGEPKGRLYRSLEGCIERLKAEWQTAGNPTDTPQRSD